MRSEHLLRLSPRPLDDDAEAPEVPEYVRVRVRLSTCVCDTKILCAVNTYFV